VILNKTRDESPNEDTVLNFSTLLQQWFKFRRDREVFTLAPAVKKRKTQPQQ
jgi:hypothetical protein